MPRRCRSGSAGPQSASIGYVHPGPDGRDDRRDHHAPDACGAGRDRQRGGGAEPEDLAAGGLSSRPSASTRLSERSVELGAAFSPAAPAVARRNPSPRGLSPWLQAMGVWVEDILVAGLAMPPLPADQLDYYPPPALITRLSERTNVPPEALWAMTVQRYVPLLLGRLDTPIDADTPMPAPAGCSSHPRSTSRSMGHHGRMAG